jgi:hypothetical protein
MVEKPLDELEQVLEDQKASRLAKKKGGVLLRSKEEKRLQRRERERRRKNKHRNRRQEEEGEEEKDFEQLEDRVGFGEVVHAPPTLNFKAGLWCRGMILIRIRPFRFLLI